MAALFGLILVSFLLLACLCISAQNGFKGDASNGYPGLLDPQTFTPDQDSVAPNYGTENNHHQSLVFPTNNELDESPPQPLPQHQDSGFQHPFNLLVAEHTKDAAVEGILFPDMNNLKQFIKTLKSSFLIPGKGLTHFPTARGVMLNEIAGRRYAKEQHDDEDAKDNKVQSERLISTYGQSENEVGYPALSPSVSVPGPHTSTSSHFPNNHGSSGPSPYQTGSSNVKTGGDWWKNHQRPEKTQFPSNSLHDEVAPLSLRGTYPLNGHRVASSIKRLKKPHLQGKVAPSQEGSYGKSVHVQASRGPIALRAMMPDGQSKETVQTTTAKDYDNVNISPKTQKSVDLSAQSPKRHGQQRLLHEPVNSNLVFFKPPLDSHLDSFPRHRPPLLNVRKPRPSAQTPDNRNQQLRERHDHIPNTQRIDSVQRGVASRNYAKPDMNASWMRSIQPKMRQTNGVYRLPSLQRPTATFHQGLPVYRIPRKPIQHGNKYGFQSRSNYVRTNVAFFRSQYMPRGGVLTRGQDAQAPLVRKT